MWHPLLPYHAPGIILILLLAAAQAACAQQGTAPGPPASRSADSLSVPPYVFDRPDAFFRLPGRLREISGLTVLDESYLGAVQDEDGRLYFINMENGEVEREEKFDKDGDYEDLARVGDRVFVLRSDGTLFEIRDWRAGKYDTRRHKTKLSSRYDTEGLAYDAAHDRLLIACKEYAGKGRKHQKAIYAFDLARERLLDDPVFTINVKAFNEGVPPQGGPNDRLRRAMQSVIDLSGFKPSAVAIHPRTHRIYVLSSVRKALVILSPEGVLEDVWPLPDPPLKQPEGMTFLSNGDLFLSTEGVDGKAALMRFNYRP